MVYKATKKVQKALLAEDLKCKIVETDGASYVQCSFSGDNMDDITLRFISRDDESDVAVRVYGVAKTPKAKRADMLQLVNDFNNAKRFTKVTLSDDGEINVEYDIATNADDQVGSIAVEICYRFVRIIDEELYPKIMKCLWA